MNKFTLFLSLICLIHFNQSQAQAFNVLDHGAIGDGQTINTEVLQKLINSVSDQGGGKIIFPEGTFLTGSLECKANVELHFQEKSVLLGSVDPADYKPLVKKGVKEIVTRDDVSQLALFTAY